MALSGHAHTETELKEYKHQPTTYTPHSQDASPHESQSLDTMWWGEWTDITVPEPHHPRATHVTKCTYTCRSTGVASLA